MVQPFPTRDFLDGLKFTFPSDRVDVESKPRPEPEPDGDLDPRLGHDFGQTPMTDPRSLGSSVAVHLVLLAVASLSLWSVALPRASEGPSVLSGELEPVDNRADKGNIPGSGGGSPGPIGGLGNVAFMAPPAGANSQANVDPAADALLREILPPTARRPAEELERALPGPLTSGVGLVPGSGEGGGGGSGGGSGGGIGRGIGPGTEFFGTREHGHSFAYVIDCSGSMAMQNSLEVAKRELLSSLGQLPPDARFSVIFYSLDARVFTDPDGKPGLMPATSSNKLRVQEQLRTVPPFGGTDHMLALRTALALKPEVIFFLTDADLIADSEVDKILDQAHGCRIQAVEFGRGRDLGMNTPLRRLATASGGIYRYIDTMSFPKTGPRY
ncbi:MAG: vWA domain-containing protein [Isosphaeraceae bacterium]